MSKWDTFYRNETKVVYNGVEMTLAEANSVGLFHNFCDDVPMSMQLENGFYEEDIKINLNEENKKRKIYNKKRGFKSFFG
jgi:hypothetical protein